MESEYGSLFLADCQHLQIQWDLFDTGQGGSQDDLAGRPKDAPPEAPWQETPTPTATSSATMPEMVPAEAAPWEPFQEEKDMASVLAAEAAEVPGSPLTPPPEPEVLDDPGIASTTAAARAEPAAEVTQSSDVSAEKPALASGAAAGDAVDKPRHDETMAGRGLKVNMINDDHWKKDTVAQQHHPLEGGHRAGTGHDAGTMPTAGGTNFPVVGGSAASSVAAGGLSGIKPSNMPTAMAARPEPAGPDSAAKKGTEANREFGPKTSGDTGGSVPQATRPPANAPSTREQAAPLREPAAGLRLFKVSVPKPYPGVQYRKTKNLDDRFPRYAVNGTTVEGVLEDNGAWLRTKGGDGYLPTVVGDIHILAQVREDAPEKPPAAREAKGFWTCCQGKAAATASTSTEVLVNQEGQR